MADRRQTFNFRFWGGARRTPHTQTPSSPPPDATTSRPAAVQPQPQIVRRQSNSNNTSATPPPVTNSALATKPTIEPQPVSRQSTIATSTARPTTEKQNPPPPGATNSAPATRPTTQYQPDTNPASTPPPKAKPQTPSPTTKSSPNSTPTAEAVSREAKTTITNPVTPPSPPAKTTYNGPPNPTPQPIPSQIVDQTLTTTLDPKKTTPNEVQTENPLTSRIDKPNTPSQTIETKSPSSSKPPSPTLRTPQSRSPPHPLSPSRPTPQPKSPPNPLSPSRPTPQSRSITSPSLSGNSKAPFTPQRASQPRSPPLLTSRSPKQTTSNSPKDRQLGSPSIKPRQTAQEASSSYEGRTLASKEKDPKPEINQQAPHLKAKVESDSADNEINDVEETKFKHNEVKEMPSKSTEVGNTATTTNSAEKARPDQTLHSSTDNGDQKSLAELQAKPEDIKDVKEVAQETKAQANEELKEEVSPSLNPKLGFEAPIIENSKTPSKPDEVHSEKQKMNSAVADDKSSPIIGQHVPLNKDAREDIPSFVTHMAMRDAKNVSNDRNVSIITLAGENRGASMQMGPTPKEGHLHIHRGYKVKPEESAETTTDGEGSSGRKQSRDGKVTEDQPTEAYVNNNAQGINNSIVFNASIAEGSPGIHMVVNHLPKEPISPAEGTNTVETRKAEFNMSHAERFTYDPTVRRRCLRGLLLETSDSDPESPEKPRRHGCRVGCEVKSKDNGIDVL